MANLHPEYDMQCEVIQWWRKCNLEGIYPSYYRLYSTDSSTRRSAAQAARWQAQGGISGIPDLFLSAPKNLNNITYGEYKLIEYCGLYIELKDSKYRNHKNGGLSDNQISVMADLEICGYRVEVCYTAAETIEAIKKYLS